MVKKRDLSGKSDAYLLKRFSELELCNKDFFVFLIVLFIILVLGYWIGYVFAVLLWVFWIVMMMLSENPEYLLIRKELVKRGLL